MEEANPGSFAKNVSLYRLHYVGASFESVGARLYIEFRIEGEQFEHVVVPWASGRRAGTAIDGAGGAELVRTVLQLRSVGDAFGKAGSHAGNIPDEPMKLIIGRFATADVHIVHMQNESHRAGGRVRPRNCRRSLIAGLRVLRGNVGTVGESRYGHGQRLGGGCPALWGAALCSSCLNAHRYHS